MAYICPIYGLYGLWLYDAAHITQLHVFLNVALQAPLLAPGLVPWLAPQLVPLDPPGFLWVPPGCDILLHYSSVQTLATEAILY